MNTTNKSIYDTTPYLKRRFKGIRYGYRPKKYDYEDARWAACDLREFQKVGEFVIATIMTDSTLGSATSIYGKKVKEGIRYRIMGEEGAELPNCTMTAPGPLSLGELINFIDGAGVDCNNGERGLAIDYTAYNYRVLLEEMHEPTYEMVEELVAECMGFTSLESPYYKQLRSHYSYIYDGWASDMLSEWEISVTPQSLGTRLFQLIYNEDRELAGHLNAKYGDDVNNLNFYNLLSCEEANSVDYLIDDYVIACQ